ncbi:ParB/RepB/Spo0J family partition protein [Sphingobium fuliginis]|uniref:ParB/RepB/Spo0J family partition protein n=1 Tax=Sphingobium fuliginis ATCC 27551 TaxID=1208342 RepID=A0A5B8CJW4_SPHSA|nr:ParB/RepB/Spo0J family partition protein [Sphingobium fuliginis]QDC39459.1 ParB/RepB/Spo0J family partition protein [Sphingobium fuliginis ATCC 27551]
MARFIRDILATLSYEPAGRGPADQQALSRLDQRLAPFADKGPGSRGTISIQPDECSVWDGNPRDQPGLTADGCRSLIDSIASEGGNRIPVLVRLNPPGSDRPYQLLVGSRRRFAVDWLNHNGRPEMRLAALVVDLSDEEAFRLADIENRERADISELDRARSYQHAVERFYGGVQSRMAEALTLSNSQLSRLLALAQLPEEVVNAFATPDELRVRYSEILTPLLRRPDQRARMIAEAQSIGEQQQALARDGGRMLSPATVLARLRDAATPQPLEEARDMAIVAGGARIGRPRPGRSGGLTIDLSISEDADLDELLARLRETIVAARAAPVMQ